MHPSDLQRENYAFSSVEYVSSSAHRVPLPLVLPRFSHFKRKKNPHRIRGNDRLAIAIFTLYKTDEDVSSVCAPVDTAAIAPAFIK